MEGSFDNGERNGVFKVWYKTGQLASDENWKEGKADGVQKKWSEDGQLLSEITFKDGDEL